MPLMMIEIVSTACTILAVGAIAVCVIPVTIDALLNRVNGPNTFVSKRAEQLHRTLLIVDLHADSLLWDRDLLRRNRRGDVDIPRLIEGNVAVQAFTIVSKMPARLGVDPDRNNADTITALALFSRWPLKSLGSLKERALHQIRKLDNFAAKSNGRLRIIKTAADLDSFIEYRSTNPSCLAGLLGIEGAHVLMGDLNNIDVFYKEGVRMMSPTHFFDNDIGGSSHGAARIGLTAKGKDMIHRMQAKSMIVDLAHASSETIRDVLAISTKPVVVSHTGVKGTCNNQRNLSDEDMIGIAKTGGIIGIGYWRQAVCGNDAAAIARAVRYAADLVGVEHVALGSDFDGARTVPFDATGLQRLTQALIDQNFSDDEVRLIMGGNALRVLRQGLPAS